MKLLHKMSAILVLALFVLSVVQAFLFNAMTFLIGMFSGHPVFSYDRLLVGLLMTIALTAINYWLLIHNDRWRRYNGRFFGYSRRKQRIGSFLVGLAVSVAAVMVVASSLEPAV
jgi:hypothetical protein